MHYEVLFILTSRRTQIDCNRGNFPRWLRKWCFRNLIFNSPEPQNNEITKCCAASPTFCKKASSFRSHFLFARSKFCIHTVESTAASDLLSKLRFFFGWSNLEKWMRLWREANFQQKQGSDHWGIPIFLFLCFRSLHWTISGPHYRGR